jgi:hypothetical protein
MQKWGEHARWLSREGTFAVIVLCREISFFLWATKDVADKAKAHLDQTGCGGGCNPVLHKGVDLGEGHRTIYERSRHVDITA